MILITMLQWFGPGKEMTPKEKSQIKITERMVTFATNMTVDHALGKIKKYQEDFNNHYRYAVNFSLINVSETSFSISTDLLNYFNVELVENLKSPGDQN